MQSAPTITKHRLFFALWPADALRVEIEQSTRELVHHAGGRAVATANLHVTLVFLGSVPVTAMDEIVATAGAIRVPAFALDFDRAEIWSRSQVLVLTTRETPRSLQSLVDGLQIRSLQSKVSREDQEYRAHITLAREVDRRRRVDMPSVSSIHWIARDFALIESRPGANGSNYTVLHRWPLA
jgi:RNA 2',3'-cyclic 3'-phosphodiesterase